MLVELKNGDTLNGHLTKCDTWMNLTLQEVIQTTADGERFTRLPEVYIKGSTVRLHLLPLVGEDTHKYPRSSIFASPKKSSSRSRSSRFGTSRIGPQVAATWAAEEGGATTVEDEVCAVVGVDAVVAAEAEEGVVVVEVEVLEERHKTSTTFKPDKVGSALPTLSSECSRQSSTE